MKLTHFFSFILGISMVLQLLMAITLLGFIIQQRQLNSDQSKFDTKITDFAEAVTTKLIKATP